MLYNRGLGKILIVPMATQKTVLLTPQKFKQLKAELKELITVGRKHVADKLEEYRSDDQTEDNSAYSEVLDEKRWMDQRISQLERTLENAEIANPSCDMDRVSSSSSG